jgi:hypothetical protein
VIIDGDVPDHPPDLGVVALLCSRCAPAARPSATRNSSPFSSIARIWSTS